MTPGSTFTLTLNIEHVQDLAGYEFDLVYDPHVVEVTGITPEPFLQSTGRQVIYLGPRMDAQVGAVAFGAVSYGQSQGVTGEGVLVSLQLRAQATGSTALKFKSDGLLFDSRANSHKPEFSGTRIDVGMAGATSSWVGTPTLTRTARPSLTGTPTPLMIHTPSSLVTPLPSRPERIPTATTPGGFDTALIVVIIFGALVAAGIGFWAGRRPRR